MISSSSHPTISATPASTAARSICVEGARVHNLKNLSVEIPRDKIVAITGVSGSGKSSLAYNTIFAEGQRQYMESLSTYARQFLTQWERPDVDLISGLPPTVAVDQQRGATHPRSTVATATEVYDFLRLLFARVGIPHCPECGSIIRQQSPEQILDDLFTLPESTRLMLLAPMVRARRGAHTEIFRKIFKSGLVRARVDGVLVEVENFIATDDEKNEVSNKNPHKTSLSKMLLDAHQEHTLEAVIDRVVLKESPEMRSRLSESLKLALQMSEGAAIAVYEKERVTKPDGTTQSHWRDILYSTLYSCPKCKTSFHELEPRSFSFNSPYGACPTCLGLGKVQTFDPDALIPDPLFSVNKGIAIWKFLPAPIVETWRREVSEFLQHAIATGELTLPKSVKSVLDIPICQFAESLQQKLFWGFFEKDSKKDFEKEKESESKSNSAFAGIIAQLETYRAAHKSRREVALFTPFLREIVCRDCRGSRLRKEARAVTIAKHRLHEITSLTVTEALAFFREIISEKSLEKVLQAEQQLIAAPIIEQIILRLDLMQRIGLDYLTLNRTTDSLSGGELQRVRLATGMGNGLVGVCYILDEPSVGLHPRDHHRLIEAMREMKARGNTVIVVEHDETLMHAADWLIDIGIGAGELGGHVIAVGTPQAVAQNPASLTGRYLGGYDTIPLPAKRRRIAKSRSLIIDGVTTHNLKNISVAFPLGTLTCVTGVSGSGKSSLMGDTLIPALNRRLGIESAAHPGKYLSGNYLSLRGAAKIDKLILVDQSPIGRTQRSNAATYTGIFDEVRHIFASTRDARARGFKASRFSFNVVGGRCEECQGQGVQKIEMHFLPDLYAVCPVCHATRFNEQTLRVKYKGLSIAEVLALSVTQALEFFANYPTMKRLLASLQRVGLGYLALGQPATTLSGGEAQRIKLATELARVETGNTLYVLDEPTSGLHTHDVRALLGVLSDLVDLGNTVIVIEHNLEVIKTADWVIDLGPEGGNAGGEIICAGTPEEIAACAASFTGRFLREKLLL